MIQQKRGRGLQGQLAPKGARLEASCYRVCNSLVLADSSRVTDSNQPPNILRKIPGVLTCAAMRFGVLSLSFLAADRHAAGGLVIRRWGRGVQRRGGETTTSRKTLLCTPPNSS